MKETVRCFGALRDVLQDLPEVVAGVDFESLRIDSMQQIRDSVNLATGGAFADATIQLEAR
ncbi:MAG TPA: hypothetical protein VLW55_02495 [Burkholderiaceae bacterium]|nr:hypothetical protein [Burkholderiaceae bacterium]